MAEATNHSNMAFQHSAQSSPSANDENIASKNPSTLALSEVTTDIGIISSTPTSPVTVVRLTSTENITVVPKSDRKDIADFLFEASKPFTAIPSYDYNSIPFKDVYGRTIMNESGQLSPPTFIATVLRGESYNTVPCFSEISEANWSLDNCVSAFHDSLGQMDALTGVYGSSTGRSKANQDIRRKWTVLSQIASFSAPYLYKMPVGVVKVLLYDLWRDILWLKRGEKDGQIGISSHPYAVTITSAPWNEQCA